MIGNDDNFRPDQSGLDDLFEAAPDASLLVGQDGQILRINQQAERLFGYSRDELLGKPIEFLIPERFRGDHVRHRKKFGENPRVRAMGSALDLWACSKDGSEFPIDIRLSPIQIGDHALVVAAVRDISDLRRVTTELSVANERLQSEIHFSDNLIATQQGIVLVLDTGGKITLVNDFFEALTGYSRGEVIGLDWFRTFIPPENQPTIQSFFADVMEEGINKGYRNSIITKSGEQRLIQWQSKTLEDRYGKVIGLLNTGFDVTEQEAAAQALLEAKHEADQATATKTRFLAAASHDLRQPLQSLGLYLTVLSRDLENARDREIANKMRQSLAAMREILDALLDISRLDSGSIVAERTAFRLQQIFDRIAADNGPYAEEKDLTLQIQPSDLLVYSDPALLQRIIENFVGNALRYTEAGKVTVRCLAVNGAARIEVSDTGIGIPEEALDTIFEEYFQLENPVRNRSKGLGLGLAIVRHLARLLDHELDVSSVRGKGSTFSVTVPLAGARAESVAAGVSSEPATGGRISACILVIDDDPAVTDATRLFLEREGFEVYTAHDGNDALAQVRGGLRPSVLLSDYRLPGNNGIEVIREIRKSLAIELPAILVTGDKSTSEIVADQLANCRFLHKPVESDRLISLINDAHG